MVFDELIDQRLSQVSNGSEMSRAHYQGSFQGLSNDCPNTGLHRYKTTRRHPAGRLPFNGVQPFAVPRQGLPHVESCHRRESITGFRRDLRSTPQASVSC